MTTKMTTKIVKLDINFILDNFLKRKLWDKKWIIFKYDKLTITFELKAIQIRERKLECIISGILNGEKKGKHISFNYAPEHRNLTVINAAINSAIYQTIESLEFAMIWKTELMAKAVKIEKKQSKLYGEKARELLDEMAIHNDDIREAYIESQENKYEIKTYAVHRRLEYTLLPQYYLMSTLFLDDEKKQKFYRAEMAKIKDIDNLEKQLKEDLKKIEVGDFYQDIELDEVF